MNFFNKLFARNTEGWEGPLPTIEITDITDDLPKHPSRDWDTRDISDINSIIVHQAVSEGTIKNIAKYHVTPAADNHISSKGAPGICYTIAIDFDGRVYQVNKLTDVVWHAGSRKWNTQSIGILLRGNFIGPEYNPPNRVKYKNPTNQQLASLEKVLTLITRDYNISLDNIYGHCEIKDTKVNCPGVAAMSFLDNFRGK